jgi:hypothetical protein
LFQSLANRADNFLDDFNDEELDNAEWAFARAGMHRIVKRLKQNRKRAVEDAAALKAEVGEVDVSGCGTIVVAGGGIGGAACAVALQKRGFNVVVLESDPSFDSRKQGYGLTVQRQDAVNAMGIDLAADDAPSTSHYTFDDKGRVLGVFGEAFGGKDTGKERKECKNSGRFIHIPRQVLRRRILEAVRPGTIRWNSALEGFRTSKKNPKVVKVKLAGGDVIDAALLVGSDGIFSTVRRNLALPGDRLNYVGLMVGARHRRGLNPGRSVDQTTHLRDRRWLDAHLRHAIHHLVDHVAALVPHGGEGGPGAGEGSESAQEGNHAAVRRVARPDPRVAQEDPARLFLGISRVRPRTTRARCAS